MHVYMRIKFYGPGQPASSMHSGAVFMLISSECSAGKWVENEVHLVLLMD